MVYIWLCYSVYVSLLYRDIEFPQYIRHISIVVMLLCYTGILICHSGDVALLYKNIKFPQYIRHISIVVMLLCYTGILIFHSVYASLLYKNIKFPQCIHHISIVQMLLCYTGILDFHSADVIFLSFLVGSAGLFRMLGLVVIRKRGIEEVIKLNVISEKGEEEKKI